jgi:hypothetical protein
MAYELIALLTDKAAVTLGQLSHELRQKFSSDPQAEILLQDEANLVVRWTEWAFRIAYEADPNVLEESREIAERYGASRPDESLLAACRRRITVMGDADPNMDHFNDYLFIEEVLMKLPGVILFDPQEKAFIDQGRA